MSVLSFGSILAITVLSAAILSPLIAGVAASSQRRQCGLAAHLRQNLLILVRSRVNSIEVLFIRY